jgi:lauroyl/myristoyl acyltransferase
VNVRGIHWRQLAYAGARYGPRFWVKYSPAAFGLAFALALPAERERIRESHRRLLGRRGRFAEDVDVVKTFVAYAHCLAESLAVDRDEAKASAPLVVGEEHLRQALGSGGAIVATAHAGGWDTAAQWLGRESSAKVLVVMAREPDAAARRLHDGVRERGGVEVAHIGHPLDSLKVFRHLRAGGIVAIQLDRETRREAEVEVTLGGRAFRVPEGPFRLAKMTGAPVVPVFSRRTGFFRYEIEVSPPIPVAPDADDQAIADAAGRAARVMEHFLSANPTQWFHFASTP